MNHTPRSLASSGGAARPGWSAGMQEWAALPVILAGTFMVTLDFFIVNVAIPSMQRELHAGTAAIQLVVAEYGLALAAGPITVLIPALLVAGAGMGMIIAPLTSDVLAGVAPRHAGAASGVLNTAVQIGGALGVALVGVIFYGSLGPAGRPGAHSHAFGAGLIYLMVHACAVAVLVQFLPRERPESASSSRPAGHHTVESSHRSTIEPVRPATRESAA